MPDFLLWLNVIWILAVIVFIHEMGHYLVARWNGVAIHTFSIGFGKELFGWNDRHGTRWRIAAVPLGGYVRFVGDMTAASTPDDSIDSPSRYDPNAATNEATMPPSSPR